MKLNGRKLAAVLLPLCALALVTYGCGTSRPEAAGGGSGSPPTTDGRCTVEGQTRDCYQLVSVQAGVRSCFQGKQACVGGAWSACGGSGTINATNVGMGTPGAATLSSEQIKIMSHPGAGSPEAGACSNPCDPGCVGYDEDASITLEASLPPSSNGLPATPPGFVDKLLRAKNGSFGKDCERWPTGDSATGWTHASCQSDYYCSRHSSGTSGFCRQFQTGPNETHAGKLGGTENGGVSCVDAFPDLTIGTPCLYLGDIMIAVCNRGAAPVASGTTIKVSEENATLVTPTAPTMMATPAAGMEMAACPTYSSNICQTTLAAPLNPGECVRMNGTTDCAGALNGNKSLYVNADKAVRECVIQTHVLGPPVSAHGASVEQPNQYGCANNYTAFNAASIPACLLAYAPQTIVIPYFPACPNGQAPQWGKLAWDASLPLGTEILWEVRTRDAFVDGGSGPWGPWVTVGDAKAAGDPAVCPMLGPVPCPKDVFGPLGGNPAARYPELELRITLTPNLAGTLAPTINSYQLAYSCVSAE